MRKVLVSLPQGVIDLMDTELKGKFGEGYSDIIRTIVMNWLGEKGYLSKVDESKKEVEKTIEANRQKIQETIKKYKL
ncbi:MAG: hypothetical protein V1850_06745 [Candidatus Bathyarchaeota archaeon]